MTERVPVLRCEVFDFLSEFGEESKNIVLLISIPFDLWLST